MAGSKQVRLLKKIRKICKAGRFVRHVAGRNAETTSNLGRVDPIISHALPEQNRDWQFHFKVKDHPNFPLDVT